MKVDVYNQKGEKLEKQANLEPAIFEVEPNGDLMAQYVRVYLNNQRQGTAATKTRSDVSGGGRKPWPQKGTGRARHGSIRSPLWRGGGVAHGPRPGHPRLNISKKMRRAALFSALSQKAHEKEIVVLDDLELADYKTAAVAKLLDKLKLTRSVLFILPTSESKVVGSVRNLVRVTAAQAKQLNAHDCLKADALVILEKSLPVIKETYLGDHE